jgi:hypothetical protein
VFLVATNRWSIRGAWARDFTSYRRMSDAAPGLPHGHVVGSAYAGRFVPHYFVGLMHTLTGFGLHTAYWIAALAAVAALAVAAGVVVAALELPWPLAALVLTAFLAAPYAGPRETILAPGQFQDQIFVVGLAIALAGLVRVRFALVFAGVLVAVAGRQTALPVLALVAIWLLADDEWRARVPVVARRARAAAAVLAGLVLYAAILAVTASFTYPFAPDSPSDTIVVSPPPVTDLATHVARTLVPALVPAAILAAAIAVLGPSRALSRRVWLCLALWASIVVQPLAITPEFPGLSSNEQRLAGLGLLPLWMAVAIVVRDAYRLGALRPSRLELGIAAVAVAVGSLSHVDTKIGPADLGQFVALQLLAAAALAGIVVAGGRAEPRPPGPARTPVAVPPPGSSARR